MKCDIQNRNVRKLVSALALVSGTLALTVVGAGAARAAANEDTSAGSTGDNTTTHAAARTTHETGTVSAIDKTARTVTLRDMQGETNTVRVPSDVATLDKLKVGDKVDIDYRESMAVSLLPPGAKPTAAERTSTMHNTGTGMGGMRTTTASLEVVSVDVPGNKVTLKTPKGQERTITVDNPDLQQRLTNLKPGQVVKVTYTEAVAAAIRPAEGASSGNRNQ